MEVTTPPGAGNPPIIVLQDNMMDKTVTNTSTILSVDNSGGLHGFSQINDSNFVPITEKSVVVYDHDLEHEKYDKFLNDLNNDLSNDLGPPTGGDSGDDGKEEWKEVRGGRKRGRGGKGVTGTKGKELAVNKQGKKGKGTSRKQAGKGRL
ncbi:MAG: hypothetical protein GY696_13295 [Gammaproteobacteria bacterium]|nr:hypothetical protein [Gammaproteobacteria bacterium]